MPSKEAKEGTWYLIVRHRECSDFANNRNRVFCKHISSYANNQLVKERTFMPFLLNTLVLLNHKFEKCKKVQAVGKIYKQSLQKGY